MNIIKTYLQADWPFLESEERKFDTFPWASNDSLLSSLDKICYTCTKEMARNRLVEHKCKILEKRLLSYRNYAVLIK